MTTTELLGFIGGTLQLDHEELASLFGVAPKRVGDWLSGDVSSADEERIRQVGELVSLLRRKLRPDALKPAFSRPNDALGGRSFAQVIAAGREADALAIACDSFDWAASA